MPFNHLGLNWLLIVSLFGISGGTENSCDDVIVLRNYDVIRLFSKPAIIRFQVLPAEVFEQIYGIGLNRSADATSFTRRVGPINLKWLRGKTLGATA